MRRMLLGTVLGTTVLLVGCAARPGSAPDDVLFLRTSKGVILLRSLPASRAVRLSEAVPSTDWSTVVRTIPRADGTRVVALDASSGRELWSREMAGNLEVRVASERGSMVALGRPRTDNGYPSGRSFTTLVLVSEDATEPRTIRLRGNFEPEAFSTDGGSLFVVQYLPARAPTRYRVRRLDLSTDRVVGVYTVDAELQEAMQGTARVQAASPDGRRLYTLYTLEGPDGVRRAFVHVLSLDELWAHCVDLPESFGTSSEQAIALSVAPDGDHLYAADAATGTVAEVDTETLAVTRSTELGFGPPAGPAHAARGPDGLLYLASGRQLVSVDASTLMQRRSWNMEEPITGIQVAKDGERLYVGLRRRIVVLGTATGGRLSMLRPGHIGIIDQLGRSTRTLDEQREVITCAC
jgi:outer membrane protein assembly factor BamB